MELSTIQEILICKRSEKKNCISEFNLIRRNSKLKEELTQKFPFLPDDIGQLLYHLRDDLSEQLCLCGSQRKFHKYDKGYHETCGEKKCISDSRLSKIKETTQRKYGVNHTSQLKSTKDKAKETMKSRYGTAHNFSGKQRETTYEKNFEKWGVKHPLQREESRKKRKDTMIRKFGTMNMFGTEIFKSKMIDIYGHENIMRNEEFKRSVVQKMQNTKRSYLSAKLAVYGISLLDINEKNWVVMKCQCSNDIEIANSSLNSFLRSEINPCSFCNPMVKETKSSSRGENEVLEFIRTMHPFARHRWINYGTGELDIFAKEMNIGIEYNGVWWHNELYRSSNFHKECTEKWLKQGVNVYHIWEDDWQDKQEIIKSRLQNIFGKSKKIYARKCELKKISSTESKTFLERNHIQGNVNASYRYGLFYDNELVQVMTFGRSRGMLRNRGETAYELLRFATELNTAIIGGASRLFKAFIQEVKPEEIVSYCDRSWSPDHKNTVYHKLGFLLEKITTPNFWYVINGRRFNRMNFQKHKLNISENEKGKTEHEIMLSRKHYRIYDAGNFKFRWTA